MRWIAPTVAATASSCSRVSSSIDVLCQVGHAMSDNVPDGDQRQQSLQTEMKERAELISVVLTTVLEEAGYASAVDQARKLFAHTTPAQMEQMKPHFSSLALEFMILAGFFKD